MRYNKRSFYFWYGKMIKKVLFIISLLIPGFVHAEENDPLNVYSDVARPSACRLDETKEATLSELINVVWCQNPRTRKTFYAALSTADEMDANFTIENYGKIYRYVGVTTSKYVNGRFYICHCTQKVELTNIGSYGFEYDSSNTNVLNLNNEQYSKILDNFLKLYNEKNDY